jgi:LysM repeat protein
LHDAAAPAAEVDDRDDADEWSQPRPDAEPLIRRNPPRDWAAPPPWASGSSAAGSYGRPTAEGDPSAPEFLASRSAAAAAGAGLAGSAADRLASGQPVGTEPSAPPSDELAGLVAEPAARSVPPARPVDRPPTGHYQTTAASGRRPTVSSTRPKTPPDHDGPSWEQAKRYEAYPTIKTRAGLPGVPRLAGLAVALVIGALLLFMLPGFLGVGGGGPASSASPTPGGSDAVASDSPEPTVSAAPTPQTYTIKSGDTLNKISKKFGLTVDALLAANKQIKNPNKIAVGDVLNIPSKTPDEVTDPSAEAPSDSPAP